MPAFRIDVTGLVDAAGTLTRAASAMDRIMRRTVDQSVAQARTNVVKAVTDETTLRGPKVKQRIVVTKRTRPHDYTAEVVLKATPFAVKDFKVDINKHTGAVRADIGPGGPRVIPGAFWPGRKPARGNRSRKKNPTKWNKKHIFERIPAHLAGRAAYTTPAQRGDVRVKRRPIRLAIVPGVVAIVERQLATQLQQLTELLGQKFADNYAVELTKLGGRSGG